MPRGLLVRLVAHIDRLAFRTGSCVEIRDRLTHVQSGTQDLLNTLKVGLAGVRWSCQEDRTNAESQLADFWDKLRSAPNELAVATKDQVDFEFSFNLKAQQHAGVTHEYGKAAKECCNEQFDSKSEICAEIEDRFRCVQSGVQSSLNALTADRAERQRSRQEGRTMMESQLERHKPHWR